MINCCNHNKTHKKCVRKYDNKIFSLPRRFNKTICHQGIHGFTMRSSCAPYKNCFVKGGQKTKRRENEKKKISKTRKHKSIKNKKQFLYNPNNPKKSFDVYIDKDPSDTIHIKYTTIDDVKHTIKKLERLYKSNKYSHKRIWQVGMIMKVRLEAMLKHQKTRYPNAKQVKQRFELANKYFKFLRKRSKEPTQTKRKNMIFKV